MDSKIKVEDKNFYERKRFVEEIILGVADLYNIYRKLQNIEEGILSSAFSVEYEKGRDPIVHFYTNYHSGLRNKIKSSISFIKDKIGESEKAGLKELPYLTGDCLGFPGKVSVENYLKNYQENILPLIQNRLERLDDHLAEERGKARE